MVNSIIRPYFDIRVKNPLHLSKISEMRKPFRLNLKNYIINIIQLFTRVDCVPVKRIQEARCYFLIHLFY